MGKTAGWLILLFIGAMLIVTGFQGKVGVLLACLLVPDSVIVSGDSTA